MAVSYHLQGLSSLAREQALQGPLEVGWEKEGELAATSLQFDYLHHNDVSTLGICFSMLVYSHAHFRFTLIGRNLTAWSKGSLRGIGGRIKNSRDIAASSPSFSCPAARAPWRACLRLSHHSLFMLFKVYSQDLSKKQTQAMTVTLVLINYGKHLGEDTHYTSVDRPNDI